MPIHLLAAPLLLRPPEAAVFGLRLDRARACHGGVGCLGDRREHGQFANDRAVDNMNVATVHNVYTQNRVNDTTVIRPASTAVATGRARTVARSLAAP
ncbi:MAG TPA: hypothetical protein VGV37_24290 [Aliidongia sp.]|uniref:hypothetical protein n=1 Tax=Aliidongia sp. TaxID=1914230 RepID=UPI002DDD5102|nr:hypothetical protein [Aliidongia sp.]HEV2677672.1 hypothetical protein [Aliidongia sp.]